MKQLRKSDIKNINKELDTKYGVSNFFNPKEKVVLVSGEHELLIHDNFASFFKYAMWVPTVKTLLKNQFLKIVTVDMGAVKFVVNGADIMRPGITDCDSEIEKDESVVIVDENNKKPLAVGIALFSGVDLLNEKSGKVIKNLHWVGDTIWNH